MLRGISFSIETRWDADMLDTSPKSYGTNDPVIVRSETVYPIDASLFGGKPVTVTAVDRSTRTSWEQIQAAFADLWEVSRNAVDTIDAYWGGEYSDEKSADVLIVGGDIVGSFDRALTCDEWQALLSVDDNLTRAREPERGF